MAAPRSGPETVRQQLAGRLGRDHPVARRGASFTERIVAELAPHVPPLACCRAALIEGMALAGEGGAPVTTRLVAARAALAVLHADSIPASVERLATARRHRYRVTIRPPAAAGSAAFPAPAAAIPAPAVPPAPPVPSANLCCSRSRLRGVFLACGSLSRGDGPPQLELLVGSEAAAARVAADLERLDIPSVHLRRRCRPVVAVRSAAGVAIGSLMHAVRPVRYLVDPIIEVTRPLPPLAFIPLFIEWFGIGEMPKVVLIFVGVLPIMVIATLAALDSVPMELELCARTLGASRRYTLSHVQVRAAIPGIVTGMRIAMAGSWTSIVAAEMIAATSGVGYLILQAGNYLRTSLVFCGIISIGIMGLLLDACLRLLLRWADPARR